MIAPELGTNCRFFGKRLIFSELWKTRSALNCKPPQVTASAGLSQRSFKSDARREQEMQEGRT